MDLSDLADVRIQYYGVDVPLNQVAALSVFSGAIRIEPWEWQVADVIWSTLAASFPSHCIVCSGSALVIKEVER
jgi:ribosome recycling factor